jgi:GNAT superfamily N-acetyltransferase
MKACVRHWTDIGCHKGLLLYASEEGRRVYSKLGFVPANVLLIDNLVKKDVEFNNKIETGGDIANVIDNWIRMVKEGIDEKDIVSDCIAKSLAFVGSIQKEDLNFTTFVIRVEGQIVASVCSQLWSGPLPLVFEENVFRLGSCWGLFVHPKFRGKRMGRALLQRCVRHWRELRCLRGIVLLPEDYTARSLFVSEGFHSGNALAIDLREEESKLRSALLSRGVIATDQSLKWLSSALPQQISSLCDKSVQHNLLAAQSEAGVVVVDPNNNWVSQNIARLGRNFDMKLLASDETQLREKFDRLAKGLKSCFVCYK